MMKLCQVFTFPRTARWNGGDVSPEFKETVSFTKVSTRSQSPLLKSAQGDTRVICYTRREAQLNHNHKEL